MKQVKLEQGQLDHGDFVDMQVTQLKKLLFQEDIQFDSKDAIVDMGGGSGCFAARLTDLTPKICVYDTDGNALGRCDRDLVLPVCSDALNPKIEDDVKLVCFNLILHHLVDGTEKEIRGMQTKALSFWSKRYLFVYEYCYESFIDGLSGKLIYWITKSKCLSFLCKLVSFFISSLRANTFGVGIRFRSKKEWIDLFESKGFTLLGVSAMEEDRDGVDWPFRLLLIKEIRRIGFLLTA